MLVHRRAYIRLIGANRCIFISSYVEEAAYAATPLLQSCREVGVAKATLVRLIEVANAGELKGVEAQDFVNQEKLRVVPPGRSPFKIPSRLEGLKTTGQEDSNLSGIVEHGGGRTLVLRCLVSMESQLALQPLEPKFLTLWAGTAAMACQLEQCQAKLETSLAELGDAKRDIRTLKVNMKKIIAHDIQGYQADMATRQAINHLNSLGPGAIITADYERQLARAETEAAAACGGLNTTSLSMMGVINGSIHLTSGHIPVRYSGHTGGGVSASQFTDLKEAVMVELSRLRQEINGGGGELDFALYDVT